MVLWVGGGFLVGDVRVLVGGCGGIYLVVVVWLDCGILSLGLSIDSEKGLHRWGIRDRITQGVDPQRGEILRNVFRASIIKSKL